ncbi:DUF7302 family protein [Glutamicibacter sp. TV12E]|uniref:DUF7302 family protein n=1 Tax=Glutamicibacter sp. TV12E TaxID=3446362 RepID=UPI0040335414
MKTLITPKGAQVRVSDDVAAILAPLGYREPVEETKPAPKKAPAKRTRKPAPKEV